MGIIWPTSLIAYMSRRQNSPPVLLSVLDKRVLNRLQRDIPFTARPWQKIAAELDIKEGALIKRIEFLKKRGIIRRIAATFNPKKIGSVSTLVAVRVNVLKADKVA